MEGLPQTDPVEATDLLTADDLRFTPPTLPTARLSDLLEARYGLKGALEALAGERDQNLRVTVDDGRRFVLKLSSADEDPSSIDLQVQVLLHLEAADPELPIPRLVPSREGRVIEQIEGSDGRSHAVRLLTYVPGVPLRTLGPPSDRCIGRIGALQGRLCHALLGFSHPAQAHFMPWDSINGLVVSPQLRERYLPEHLAQACEPLLNRLERHALTELRALPAQVIHNDAHAGNLLCEPAQPDRISGLIDFGDVVERPLVVDVSTSIVSVIERNGDPGWAASLLIAGFEQHMKLPDEQIDLLPDALAARALLTVQLLSFRIARTPGCDDLREIELPNAIVGLERVLRLDRDPFCRTIREGRRAARASGSRRG